MSHARRAIAAVITLAATMLGACGSPWQAAYEGVGKGVYPPTERVEVRLVPWERLSPALDGIQADIAASDTHPTEWTGDRLDAQRRTLLTALQVSEDPDRVEILGNSLFRTTDPLRASDTRLAKFARTLGADLVVASSVYTGKADRIVRERVTTESWRSVPYKDKHGHRRYRSEPYTESVSVPVVIEADEHAWAVYFLRRE